MATATAKRTKRDGGSQTGAITYEDLYRRWEEGELEGDRHRLLRGPQGLGGAERDPAQVGALDLLDVLLRRGLGHRQPLPLHRRRAEGGAEVLPRDAAGRRGPPLGLLPSLLQGGDRRRRRRSARRSPTPRPQLGWGYRNVFDRLDRMGDELRQRPLAAEVRAGDRALPHGRRGDPGPARAALHRGLLRRRPARCPASARACTTSRATSSATSASASRCSPSASASRTSARPRSPRSCARSCRYSMAVFVPPGLGPRVHALLRLRARGHLRVRDALGARRSGRRPAIRSRRCRRTSIRSTSRCRTRSARSARSR